MNNAIFHDIYDYNVIANWYDHITLSIIIMILIIFFIISLFIWYRYRKNLTPWDLALLDLSKQHPSACKSKQDFKKLYFHLTFIIKNYLHSRYQWAIIDKTDQELVEWLEEKQCAKNIIDTIKKISNDAIWIKFANVEALLSQAEENWKLLEQMIIQTKPKVK